MPLPSGPLMTAPETQAGVSKKVQQAMQDLALKGEMQRQAKAEAQVKAAKDAVAAAEAAEVEAIRVARIERMKKDRAQADQNLARGHGQVATISQDEFLDTVLASTRCVVHFFHAQFEQCLLMDKHLAALAPLHVETRFARINSEKAPFFVEKLAVRVLPTLILFEDGKAIGRQVGFQGLGEDDNLVAQRLERVLIGAGVAEGFKLAKGSDDEAEAEEERQQHMESRSFARAPARLAAGKHTAEEEDDW